MIIITVIIITSIIITSWLSLLLLLLRIALHALRTIVRLCAAIESTFKDMQWFKLELVIFTSFQYT